MSGSSDKRPAADSPPASAGERPKPPDPPTAMTNATGKRILALVRDADYAHPGEEAANRLLFAGVRRDPRRRLLDVGCGGGGTAAWTQQQGFGAATGLELDGATARLARERHPELLVVEGDVQRAGDVLQGRFDLLYSMTAIYAVSDQVSAFRELGALAAPGAELRLLEYADPQGRFEAAAAGRSTLRWWLPLAPRDLPQVLSAAGWASVTTRDLHPEFVFWYADLCRRIAARRDDIARGFGRDWYDFVAGEYATILDLVRKRALGGVLVRARR